ncbi:MAG: Zn-ribbon domain-containing OB-fold protein [Candidatus Bathyarchaeota archaeon]|nr:Zn-ribbon domain-containing OB-fold protein [Candidatus Bathyarchaeota archaeon]
MSVPRYWREEVPRYRLQGKKCKACGAKYFPARPVCTCGSTEFGEYKLSETGEVVTWTVIRNPPMGYEKYKPYMVGLIELDDGIKILSQVVDVDPEEVSAGLKVEAVFRKVKEDGKEGIIQYGYKFRPVVE